MWPKAEAFKWQWRKFSGCDTPLLGEVILEILERLDRIEEEVWPNTRPPMMVWAGKTLGWVEWKEEMQGQRGA